MIPANPILPGESAQLIKLLRDLIQAINAMERELKALTERVDAL